MTSEKPISSYVKNLFIETDATDKKRSRDLHGNL